MKKVLAIGLLTVALAAASQQEASAWVKWNFSAGINFSYESGNNSWLWGAFKNGQVPGYPTDGYYTGPCGAANSFGCPPGGASYGMPYNFGYAAAPTSGDWQAPAPAPAPAAPKKTEQAYWYGNQHYQPAVYYYPAANNYYYQPPQQFNYYQQQVPSYWYGQ